MANTKKILVGMSPALLGAIDQVAAATHSNRSEYIRNALRTQLKAELGTVPGALRVLPPINATTATTEPEEYTATVV